jgi:asparagine synthetase B (glutamine-hydrolysing)
MYTSATHIDSKLMIPTDVRQQDMVAELDREAICIWAAFGFMLNCDTFFKDVKWNKPQTADWYYKPENISFDASVEKFAAVFESVISSQIADKDIMLALSGGLDSRTLAAAVHRLGGKAFTYSYKFHSGADETKYGKAMAKIAGWEFEEYTIPKGYLWNKIDELAEINQCYSEFTHARQMAVMDKVAPYGNLFLLGHLGDLVYDGMGLDNRIPEHELRDRIIKKMLKKGGFELGQDLWNAWSLDGDFKAYLEQRVGELLSAIKIDNVNARAKAFKSMYWVTRWTNVNLQVFSHYHPIALPYYDERICKLVCETPEIYLRDRKIQIEYLKRYAPAMAKIPWQDKEPYNLFNHSNHLSWKHMPWRVANKAKRVAAEKLMGSKHVMRNWEIQFEGDENDNMLRLYLFENAELKNEIPEQLINKYYNNFKTKDAVYNSHPVSMLLTFSAFLKRQKKLKQLV